MYYTSNEVKDIARKIRNSDEWLLDECRKLCDAADMLEDWDNADGDTFEDVVFAAADKLGIDII